jgi:branched-chain amino acid aminotransferase
MNFSFSLGCLLLLGASSCAAFSVQQQCRRNSAFQMSMAADTQLGQPGTAKLGIPWAELGFEFRPTKSHVRIVYRDGEWGPTELVKVGTGTFETFRPMTF